MTDKDLEFYDRISPVLDRKKYSVPTPTLCPRERERRRLSWRNEYKLYPAKCAGTGKNILSVYNPSSPIIAYDMDYWWSDAWDPMEYGRGFDFDRPFFVQFGELKDTVPQIARSAMANQNCDYINQAGWNKDCYLTFECAYNEKCYYAHNITSSKSCFDCLMVDGCELCYDCIDCTNCFELRFSQDCQNCSDSAFLKNCIGCRHCFGCTNLRNKEYYYLDQPLDKEAYERKIADVSFADVHQLVATKKYFYDIARTKPHRYMQGVKNEGVTGDYIYECKDCYSCFDLRLCRDCRYTTYLQRGNFVYDTNVFGGEK